MVAWFLGLEDVLSLLLVGGKRDVLVVIDEYYVELMVVGELLEADIVGNEKVFHKIVNDVERNNIVEQLVITVVDSGSGMLDVEEILKLLEEEMVNLKLQVYGNVIDQEDQYKLDEEALNLALEEEARVEHEWLEKSCALEVDAVGALNLLEIEEVGALELVEMEESCLVEALDLVGLSLNILVSASVSGYLTSLNKIRSSSPKTSSSLDTRTTSTRTSVTPPN
nr:hypothetical protein [Tanacetum cinerariifolium]GEY34725.1 hypothetical protein [Tanacetum cinerariifolium]